MEPTSSLNSLFPIWGSCAMSSVSLYFCMSSFMFSRHPFFGRPLLLHPETSVLIYLLQISQPSRFWRDSPAFLPDVPRPAKSWKCPAFCTKPVFLAHAQFVTLPRCLNANHPIELNYRNSVRFLAKINYYNNF